MKKTIILVRHGQSVWNQENRFTGWADVDLNSHGEKEAIEAGKMLKSFYSHLSCIYTSFLKRSIATAWNILRGYECLYVPLYSQWRLNERHYGSLTGANKDDAIFQYGEDQVMKWRRGYYDCPPDITSSCPYLKKILCVPGLVKNNVPLSESLYMTYMRVFPLWKTILSSLEESEVICIVSHTNVIRSIIIHEMKIDIHKSDLSLLSIPTCNPLVLEYRKDEDVRFFYLDKDRAGYLFHAT